jgi:mono/diheme cytochrome c family protein/glucose/arabinose dehydrogenase
MTTPKKFFFTRTDIAAVLIFSFFVWSCSEKQPPSGQDGPSPARAATEELETFQIDDGLEVQLVADEPMVQDPVVITFDENGRLWVVEMRNYMPDIDGKGEDQKGGRISVLEDTDGDGTMDKTTIYLDSLVLPRAVAPVAGGALYADNKSLWLTEDTNGDLVADRTTLIDSMYAGANLPEHSGNGLWRAMDNWYYNVKSRLRYKNVAGKWLRDSTEFRGQWGVSQDDKGRLFYNYNWSQLHADLVPPNYFSRNKNHKTTSGIDHGVTLDRRVYPIRETPAVNRGYIPGTLSDSGKLLEFTAACSPLIYRGNALPKQYYGNAFVCEPAGNLVKRNIIIERGAIVNARDPNPGREFFASTDERFRPVHSAIGPDGALYVVDMYRGLIQHRAYVTPYLREQTLNRKLVLPIHCGRIWRIVPKGWNASKAPQLQKLSTAQLAEYLTNENGWYRDVAQRLLVERADRSAELIQKLKTITSSNSNHFARAHALWTLEGLGLLDAEYLFPLANDADTFVSATAIRLLEPFCKSNKTLKAKLEDLFANSIHNAPADKLLQQLLTSGLLSNEFKLKILPSVMQRNDTSALFRDALMSSIPNIEFQFLSALLKNNEWETKTASHEIFVEMLTTAVVKKHDDNEIKSLVATLGNSKAGWKERSIVTAMAIQGGNGKAKPVKLKSKPALLNRTDLVEKSRLEMLSAMLEWPGHEAKKVATSISKLSERELQQFANGRQLYLISCAGCHGSDGAGIQRFAPPLAGSDWVLGDEKRLALIVLHGIEGPIEVNGKTYDKPEILPVMPSLSTMDDNSITAILTYIRNEWGNNAGAMSNRTVGSTRHTSQGRVVPWTPNELNQHMIATKDVNTPASSTKPK